MSKNKTTQVYIIRLTGKQVTLVVAALVKAGFKKLAEKILSQVTKN